ncbi:STY4528 family pathogenicity island replication protein [Xenorhabdus griffiniae]|uniref:STY4528 family pathogenicity island replication protein n=1 Tax=Xenorhabdus griffiniae TaxID=351672 RepID=UPI0023591FA6|nr:STY4528 family pathogenicity island replication protein [Xenorhabdus griffiniae]MDC9606961.1 STY4528 family pathogenicity island replication protein [Xenorhabdus griffiniae]
MAISKESLISFTLEKMQQKLACISEPTGTIRSGLIYAGNIHDSIPRQLLLDNRLSPFDKLTWMMIRLYAQQNDGATFPTYDELQLQLASPNNKKASRETISRALLVLRVTGWLSLCRRVRDNSGCIRGNIYMQHDEPISALDAEILDPRWLDILEKSCSHENKSVRFTARAILQEVKDDPLMKHQHSRIKIIENRLGTAQTPQQVAAEQEAILGSNISPKNKNRTQSKQSKSLSSEIELSQSQPTLEPSSKIELSVKSDGYNGVRNSNHYVRNFTHGVKETYVSETSILIFSDKLKERLGKQDSNMLLEQLCDLPTEQAKLILNQLESGFESGSVRNPVGYALTLLKSAREGRYSHNANYKNHKVTESANLEGNKKQIIEKGKKIERKKHPAANTKQIKEHIYDIRKKLCFPPKHN